MANKRPSKAENGSFVCTLCSFTSNLRANLKSHTEEVHNKIMGPLECCGICFSGQAALQHHTEAHHILRYECPLCDSRFHSPSHLQRHHIAVHSELKEFKCNLCEYATNLKYNLKKHMERKTHRKGSDKDWLTTRGYKKGHKCEICYRTYPYPSKLRYHMRFTHGEQNPFKCNLCDYTTEKKSHLKRHLQLHEHRDKSTLNNASFERSRTSTNVNVNGTDACEPPQEEEDVETFTVYRPLRNLRSTVQLETANRKNELVVEKKRSTRKTGEESEDPAPSCTSNNIDVDSSHHSENVEFVEMRDNPISPTSSVEPSQGFSFRPALETPIHEEARKLKSEVLSATTLPVVLSLLERLLDLSASIMHQIRSSMEVEARHEAIESFEYVWGAFKIAVRRWGGMVEGMVEGSMDRSTFLKAHKAVKYAYKILPVFVSLEINEHQVMVENVMFLALNTVKNCQHPSSTREF